MLEICFVGTNCTFIQIGLSFQSQGASVIFFKKKIKINIFEIIFLCLPYIYLINQNLNKNSNIPKYYYNLK